MPKPEFLLPLMYSHIKYIKLIAVILLSFPVTMLKGHCTGLWQRHIM